MQNQNTLYLTDLGEIAYLHLVGHYQKEVRVNNVGQVVFLFDRDVEAVKQKYWTNSISIPPLRYKMELDSIKRFVFNELKKQKIKF